MKESTEQKSGQLMIFPSDSVYTSKLSVSQKGDVTEKMVMRKKADIAKELGLSTRKDSAQLARIMLANSDEKMLETKGDFARLDDNWTFKRSSIKLVKKTGLREITIVVREVDRADSATMEEYAAAFGVTVAELKAILAEKREQERMETLKRADEAKEQADKEAAEQAEKEKQNEQAP